MGAFCWHGNQTTRQITLIVALLNCPYQSNICTKLESYCFSGFRRDVIYKNHFIKFNVAWQPNKMAICHKAHKLGRQSSNDHNCQIWFTALHWLWRKCNLTIFPLQVYGRFLLPWQPNKEADHHNFSFFKGS